jgi:DNA recombination protein RmuC
MSNSLIYILIAIVAAFVAWIITNTVLKARMRAEKQKNEAALKEKEAACEDEHRKDETKIAELNEQIAVLNISHATARERESSLEKQIEELRESSKTALDAEKAAAEKRMEELKESHQRQVAELKAAHERSQEELKAAHEKSKEELKLAHEKALKQQIEALRTEMTAQTEAVLKQREKELSDRAEKTFKDISGDLGKDLKDMKEAFEAGKKAQLESSTTLKERFDSAVGKLEAQTKDIGSKADHLAEALRGQKKFQGCWGETILLNLLQSEGLVEGRDFDKESTLRDSLGFVVVNEDSEKKMRPDFILHFPDDNDIVIDSKVSLAAYSDWVEADSEAAKADAAKRNTQAIKDQVTNLSKKNYSKYLLPGHRMLDYVIMFIPNYPALQLAYNEDKNIWKNAYASGVLITTEETLMPFLRMITIAWTNVEQARNQQKIITAAENMIERVADFAKSHEEMGRKLDDVRKCYDACSDKIKNSGRSILTSARQVMELGVKMNPNKSLPDA